MLRALVSARREAKREVRRARDRGDSAAAEVLEARQLSLKMCANASAGRRVSFSSAGVVTVARTGVERERER